jgi:hypothetical protein
MSRLLHEREKRLQRNELARLYHWKRRNLLAPLNADFRGAKSAHIRHRNPQCFSRILLLFVS